MISFDILAFSLAKVFSQSMKSFALIWRSLYFLWYNMIKYAFSLLFNQSKTFWSIRGGETFVFISVFCENKTMQRMSARFPGSIQNKHALILYQLDPVNVKSTSWSRPSVWSATVSLFLRSTIGLCPILRWSFLVPADQHSQSQVIRLWSVLQALQSIVNANSCMFAWSVPFPFRFVLHSRSVSFNQRIFDTPITKVIVKVSFNHTTCFDVSQYVRLLFGSWLFWYFPALTLLQQLCQRSFVILEQSRLFRHVLHLQHRQWYIFHLSILRLWICFANHDMNIFCPCPRRILGFNKTIFASSVNPAWSTICIDNLSDSLDCRVTKLVWTFCVLQWISSFAVCKNRCKLGFFLDYMTSTTLISSRILRCVAFISYLKTLDMLFVKPVKPHQWNRLSILTIKDHRSLDQVTDSISNRSTIFLIIKDSLQKTKCLDVLYHLILWSYSGNLLWNWNTLKEYLWTYEALSFSKTSTLNVTFTVLFMDSSSTSSPTKDNLWKFLISLHLNQSTVQECRCFDP